MLFRNWLDFLKGLDLHSVVKWACAQGAKAIFNVGSMRGDLLVDQLNVEETMNNKLHDTGTLCLLGCLDHR